MCVCVCVLKLTFRVHGSPAVRSCLEERAPSWLSGDCCAGLLYHMTNLHNVEYICSRGSQTDLKREFNGSLILVNKHFEQTFSFDIFNTRP